MKVKVLCKDCHYKETGNAEQNRSWIWCNENDKWVDDDDYCSWGIPETQWREEEASLFSDEEPEVPDKWVQDFERERMMENDW